MSVLALVPVVMIIMFRKYVNDEESLKKTGYIFLGHAVVILLLAVFWWSSQKSQTPPSPEEYKDFDTKFKLFVVGISALIMGVYWKKIFTRNSFYMPLDNWWSCFVCNLPGCCKIIYLKL